MGTFHVDSTDYKVKSETVAIDGRNLIGKILKDQTLNEMANTRIQNHITKLNQQLVRIFADLLQSNIWLRITPEARTCLSLNPIQQFSRRLRKFSKP